MKEIILCKLGEIVLKGLNRKTFERKLLSNLSYRLGKIGNYDVSCMQSTIYVRPKTENDSVDAAFEACSKVFGIVTLNRAVECEKNEKAIAKLAIEYLKTDMQHAKSFKVESKRSDKNFHMTSIELSQYVGGELSEAYLECIVDVKNPELTVTIEIRDIGAYIHATPIRGAGGMPVGSNGVAVTLLSGGIDSPVSTYMIAKRGVRLIPVHFFSFPYTSQLAKEKVIELAQILTEYCGRMIIEIVPFTHIQEEIRDKCDEEYFTLIMRRFMMRIAQRIADDNGAKGIVTGENLGQVASQTMEAMAATRAVCRLPIIQPLIGFDKSEIVKLARNIGTFDTSILPYEDCCTVFTPKHPRTKPRLEDVERVESALDVQQLVDEALAGIEKVIVE